jgi:uncharacterized membrane protein
MEGVLVILAVLACPLMMLAMGAVAWAAARVRGGTRGERPDTPSGRALLERRLAAGEIDVEEYYEREAALRSAEPALASRRRWRP